MTHDDSAAVIDPRRSWLTFYESPALLGDGEYVPLDAARINNALCVHHDSLSFHPPNHVCTGEKVLGLATFPTTTVPWPSTLIERIDCDATWVDVDTGRAVPIGRCRVRARIESRPYGIEERVRSHRPLRETDSFDSCE